jgi:hypothetical protein
MSPEARCGARPALRLDRDDLCLDLQAQPEDRQALALSAALPKWRYERGKMRIFPGIETDSVPHSHLAAGQRFMMALKGSHKTGAAGCPLTIKTP